MQTITLYLGLDVHKDSITIAIAEPGSKGEIRLFGTITNDVDRLEKALGRIRKAHPDAHLEVAYEAGPSTSCGVTPNDIDGVQDVFTGGTIQANLCWKVHASDIPTLVMYWRAGSAPGPWFALH